MKPRPIYHLDGEPGFRGGERQLLYLAAALRDRVAGRNGLVVLDPDVILAVCAESERYRAERDAIAALADELARAVNVGDRIGIRDALLRPSWDGAVAELKRRAVLDAAEAMRAEAVNIPLGDAAPDGRLAGASTYNVMCHGEAWLRRYAARVER